MARAFLYGIDLLALPVDGFDTDSGKSGSRSPSSPAASTCAGSLPCSAFSSPESLYCESNGAPVLELPWPDEDFASTVGVIEVEQVTRPESHSCHKSIAPPPGLEPVKRREAHSALGVCAPPGLGGAGIPNPPPGLAPMIAPPGLGLGAPPSLQAPLALPRPPLHSAPTLPPAFGVSPSPPPPPSTAPALAAAPLAVPQLPPPARHADRLLGLPPPPPAAPPLAFAPRDAPSREVEPRAEAPTGALEFPSAGSVEHRFGTCKPCAFYHTKGCSSGSHCTFCHLCGPKEMSQRKKEKKIERQYSRMNRVNARVAKFSQ